MIRIVPAVVAGLLLVGMAGAADSKKVVLSWHGQSCFEVESSKGTRIVFDPHAIEAYGRQNFKLTSLVLMSHDHNDHTQLSAIDPAAKPRVIRGLKTSGKKQDWNIVDEQFKDIHIRSIGVYHDNRQGLERGKNTIFIVEVDGLKIVHLGDLGHVLTDAQAKAIGPVDVLMIPVGGVYTINGSEAKKVIAQLHPRMYILPMHYGTKVFDDLLPLDEFLDEQKPGNIRWYSEDQSKDKLKRLGLTNKLTVETAFKTEEPIIVVLNWRR